MMVPVLVSKFYLIGLKEHEDSFFSFWKETPSTQCLIWNGFKQTTKNIADLDCDMIEKMWNIYKMVWDIYKKRT